MRGEYPAPPETLVGERVIEGEEREKFSKELTEYISGLEASLADPDLAEDDRADLEVQLAALKDSQQAIAEGGEVKVKE